MKILIVFIATVTLVCASGESKDEKADEKKQFLERISAECSEEIGIDLDSARKLLLGDLSINSVKAKCFVRCFFKKEGFLNDADEPQQDFIVDSLLDAIPVPRPKLKRIVDKCSRLRQTDPCEKSFELLACFFRATAAVASDEL